MNNTLIDQLKLAIQVESGEVSLGEVQRRLNEDYISKDKTAMTWNPIASDHTPKNWSLKEYEYRRKPKPLELWFVFYDDRSAMSYESSDMARNAFDREKNSIIQPIKIVHMREVTE